MFENSGRKIQLVAVILFWVLTIVSVISAIVRWREWGGDGIFFLFLIGGPLIAYVSNLCMHAFGELVENVSAIRRNGKNTDQGNTKEDALPEL